MKPTIQVITPASRGAYDCKRSATLLYTSTSGTGYLISDFWCGGNTEGECYRTHIAKLDCENLPYISNRTQFPNGQKFTLDPIEFDELMQSIPVFWVRYRHANPTHRRILEKAQKMLCA